MIRDFEEKDISQMNAIWNEIVEEGIAFPQRDLLDAETGYAFFASQVKTRVFVDDNGQIPGLYILHPNNIGRVGHIANASYAVRSDLRGQHIGEALVRDSLEQARSAGFRIMQFNAVVDTNVHALHLYERLGFVDLGIIPGGFLIRGGHYEDIHVMYHDLTKPTH